MNKRSISLLLTLVMIASVCAVGTFSTAAATIDGVDDLVLSDLPTMNGMMLSPTGASEAPLSEEEEAELLSEAAELPASIDLRNYNGKNYVTPVKLQNPFGSCWTFAIMAAAEISYLYENDMGVPAGEVNDQVDFSEKPLSWYLYHVLTDADVKEGYIRESQVGEGVDISGIEAEDINASYKIGGMNFYGLNYFASGFGPVDESIEIDGDTPFCYSGVNGWRLNGIGDDEESDALRKEYYRDIYRGIIDLLIEEGYIESEDEFDDFFDANWHEGRNYAERNRSISNYAPYDDWSLPLGADWRVPGASAVLKEGLSLPSPVAWDENGDYVFVEAGVAAVKTEIAKGHGVTVAFIADQSLPDDDLPDDGWMNTENWAQYYAGPAGLDHAVTIVGYDDNYPKENFTRMIDGEVVEGSTPPGDGAFIIKNSWGAITDEDRRNATVDEYGNMIYENPNASNWGIDDSGYFYLSYYDHSITQLQSFSFYTKDELDASALRYDQYDLFCGNSYSGNSYAEEVKVANVFDVQQDAYLSMIYFYRSASTIPAHYEIYLDPQPDAPDSGVLIEEGRVDSCDYGILCVELQDEHFLRQGQIYSVVITQTQEGADGTVVYFEPLSIGYTTSTDVDIAAVINPGESYTYDNGEWYDLYDYVDVTIDGIFERWYEQMGDSLWELMPNGTDMMTLDNYPVKGVLIPASLHGDIRGDVNGDGAVTIIDAVLIQRRLAGLDAATYNERCADADGDGEITILDATCIQRWLADYPAPDGFGEAI